VLRVAVTATNAANAPAAQSAPSDLVAARPPVNTTRPPSRSEQALAPEPAKPAEPPSPPLRPIPSRPPTSPARSPRRASSRRPSSPHPPPRPVLVASTGEWASDEAARLRLPVAPVRRDGTNCADIPGATGHTYTMAPATRRVSPSS